MDSYLKCLVNQYKSSRGIEDTEINLSDYKNDFNNWLYQYKRNGEKYLSLLNILNLDINNVNTAEVNKGKYDSVVLPYKTSIISPYMTIESRKNINKSNFEINRGIPCYDNLNNDVYRFMTHNPYTNVDGTELTNWRYMHEFTDYEIILGMFGNIEDADRENKIEMLKIMKKCTFVPLIEKYELVGDSYFYVMASKPKKLIRKNDFYK